MKDRYVVMARWQTSPPDKDPIEYDIVRKECDTVNSALGAVKLLMKQVRPFQISITDTKQMVIDKINITSISILSEVEVE